MKFGFSCINSSISTIFNRSKKMTSFIKLYDLFFSYIAFLKFLVLVLLLRFVAESIRLVWIKWLKSLFREAENESYYRMLLSLLFSKRMHVVRPKCIWKTRWKFFSFVIHCSIWTLSWLKKPQLSLLVEKSSSHSVDRCIVNKGSTFSFGWL